VTTAQAHSYPLARYPKHPPASTARPHKLSLVQGTNRLHQDTKFYRRKMGLSTYYNHAVERTTSTAYRLWLYRLWYHRAHVARREWRHVHHLREMARRHAMHGSPVSIGRELAARRGWTGSQFHALYLLWNEESGWNPNSVNASSGACGIPQALPCSKIPDHSTAGQIRWGLSYIAGRYGNPLNAYDHLRNYGWY
jgi:hypothetical protein